MGACNHPVTQAVTEMGPPPGEGDFELTLLGPGYGESLVLHVGGGIWVLVDSCHNAAGSPQALQYLENIGINPSEVVDLIVATHWHDDHIRGIAKLVETCKKSDFLLQRCVMPKRVSRCRPCIGRSSSFRCRFRTAGDSRCNFTSGARGIETDAGTR